MTITKHTASGEVRAARFWHRVDDERIQCDLCPRQCRLREGQRGFCFVRANHLGQLVLTTYGRSSGFCIDPVEKKPLYHFHPGSPVLSFGTAGCNLGCKFCQNWDISKASEFDRLTDQASPEEIAHAARTSGCDAVAYTYNDPVIFAEYAIDVAEACRDAGVRNIGVTAGYVNPDARAGFFRAMDAVNIDLKGFSDTFYATVTGGRLRPVLETIAWVAQETSVWMELTTLLIPGYNDATSDLRDMCDWVFSECGPDVPLHFTAFHPDHRMRHVPATPARTLSRARMVALEAGLNYVYTGNVHDQQGQATSCPNCGTQLIGRNWFEITSFELTHGACPMCGNQIAGHFDAAPGGFGNQRIALAMPGGLGPLP